MGDDADYRIMARDDGCGRLPRRRAPILALSLLLVLGDTGSAQPPDDQKREARIYQSISDYDKAIALNPKDAALASLAYSVRGNAKFQLKDWRGAISDYD